MEKDFEKLNVLMNQWYSGNIYTPYEVVKRQVEKMIQKQVKRDRENILKELRRRSRRLTLDDNTYVYSVNGLEKIIEEVK